MNVKKNLIIVLYQNVVMFSPCKISYDLSLYKHDPTDFNQYTDIQLSVNLQPAAQS